MAARPTSPSVSDTPLPLIRLPRFQHFTHGCAQYGPVAFAVVADDSVEMFFEDLSAGGPPQQRLAGQVHGSGVHLPERSDDHRHVGPVGPGRVKLSSGLRSTAGVLFRWDELAVGPVCGRRMFRSHPRRRSGRQASAASTQDASRWCIGDMDACGTVQTRLPRPRRFDNRRGSLYSATDGLQSWFRLKASRI